MVSRGQRRARQVACEHVLAEPVDEVPAAQLIRGLGCVDLTEALAHVGDPGPRAPTHQLTNPPGADARPTAARGGPASPRGTTQRAASLSPPRPRAVWHLPFVGFAATAPPTPTTDGQRGKTGREPPARNRSAGR